MDETDKNILLHLLKNIDFEKLSRTLSEFEGNTPRGKLVSSSVNYRTPKKPLYILVAFWEFWILVDMAFLLDLIKNMGTHTFYYYGL